MKEPMDQRMRMRVEVSRLDELLFQLGYALQPLCPGELRRWGTGAALETYVGVPDTGSDLFGLRARNALLRTIAPDVAPGERVVISDRPGTPQGAASIRLGDVILKSEKPVVEKIVLTDAGALGGTRHFSEELQRMQINAALKSAASPGEIWMVRRGGEKRQVRVRYVEVCAMALFPVDSEWRYVDASDGSIYLTLPLLRALSEDELKVVLALEASRIAMGETKSWARQSAIAKELLPAFINKETGLQAVTTDYMKLVDGLAIRIALVLGIEPDRYLEIVKKLDTIGGFFQRGMEYSVARQMDKNRLAELEDAARAWKQTRRITLPEPDRAAGITETVQERLRQALNEPQRVFSAEEK